MTHKRIPLLFLVATLGLLVAIVGLSRSLFWLMSRKTLLTTKQEELAKHTKKSGELRTNLILVQTPEFIEREAREKLNLGKPGETVVLVEKEGFVPVTSSSISDGKPNWKKWWHLFF